MVTATADVIVVEASWEKGVISAALSDDKLAALLFRGRIVILKRAVAPELVLRLREALTQWAKHHDPFPHGSSPREQPEVNYHRVDDGKIASSIPHLFHQFGLNSIEELDADLSGSAETIRTALRGLQNRVAGTRFVFSPHELRLKVLHYPAGGGYLAQHVHPLEPQRVGLILSASRIGGDVVTGGTYFETPAGRVDTSRAHDIGDVILFRYDIPHGVAAVDPGSSLEWHSDVGKWSIVLDLSETHTRSQET